MSIISILKIIAVIVTILTGVYSLVLPKKLKGINELVAATPFAVTEIRAVMGGTFIGLGIAALIFPVVFVYYTLAITYTAIALIRVIYMLVDKSIDKSNLILLASEAVLAIVLYYPV